MDMLQTEIAAMESTGVPLPELRQYMAGYGWELDKMRAEWAAIAPVAGDYLARTIAGYAKECAKRHQVFRARLDCAAARRTARMTPAARARPDRQCTRCDGSGRVIGFSHIAGGVCFSCDGKGVRR